METKDLVPIVISLAAFVVSLVTLYRSIKDTQRAIRSQITDIVSKLLFVVNEINTLRAERLKDPGNLSFGNKLDSLKRQSLSLAEYAESLVQARPGLAIASDYSNLATAFEMNGFDDKAKIYWEESIKACQRDRQATKRGWYIQTVEGINTRRYADLLFRLGEEDQGREEFKKAINLFTIEQDEVRWQRGFTQAKWSHAEAQISRMDDAQQHLQEARETYKTIKNEKRRKDALQSLEQ